MNYYSEFDSHAAAWLRGYGNAIVPPQAAQFVTSYMAARGEVQAAREAA